VGMVVGARGRGGLAGAVSSGAVGRRAGTGRTVILAHICSAVGVLVLISAGLAAHGGEGNGRSTAASAIILFTGMVLHGFGIGLSNSHEMAYRISGLWHWGVSRERVSFSASRALGRHA